MKKLTLLAALKGSYVRTAHIVTLSAALAIPSLLLPAQAARYHNRGSKQLEFLG
jgi:hypothetical protein